MAKSRWIRVDVGAQCLELLEGEHVTAQYPVSTALAGVGEQTDSERTPRGRHAIAEKIGGECPTRAVFVARRPTGEVCTPERFAAEPDRDWILTRILWLEGLEAGRNAGPGVDSKQRYIYIHGTPDEERIGVPASHGCVRMRNDDVIDLFERVEVGTVVFIDDGGEAVDRPEE